MKLRPYGAIQICLLLLVVLFQRPASAAGNETVTIPKGP